MATLGERAYTAVQHYLAVNPDASQKTAFEIVARRLGSTPNSVGVAFYKLRAQETKARSEQRERKRASNRAAYRRNGAARTKTEPVAKQTPNGDPLHAKLDELVGVLRAPYPAGSDTAGRGRAGESSWSGL